MSDSTTDLVQLPLFDPITIKLTKGYEAIIDPIDADLAAFKWCVALSNGGRPYAVRYAVAKTITRLHSVIMSRILDRPLVKGEFVDHIDNNPLNDRRDNLRLATIAQNSRNAKLPSTNKSGFKGVTLQKGRYWRACIKVNGKTIHLGHFATAEEAYAAYCEAAKKYFGEFFRPK